jgi:4-hydroxybenzoate polyprenyltransferase
MRLDKPIGFMLLFWPCSWGLASSLYMQSTDETWFFYLLLFFFGSILMRSAGCVYNDIIDKKIDQKVSRTKNRPLAANLIGTKNAWIIILLLCGISLIILFQFNFEAIIFGLSSGFLIILYPFMKRITFWPQLFLGIVFNWGVILSWLALNQEINLYIILLYASAVFWTLGYDTIYGLQDLEDDIKIGTKSTSIKFKKNLKLFLLIVYFISFSLLISSQINLVGQLNYLMILFSLPLLILIFQIYFASTKNNDRNLMLFKMNNYYGLSIFLIQIIILRNA